MSRDLMTMMRQEWLQSFVRMGTFALASLLLVTLASSAQAQTFDQAVQNACTANIGVCQGIPGASSGSTTTLTRESSPVEERKVQRLIGPINLFISGEYERFNKDVTKFEPGYKTDTGRAAIGADYSFSDSVLIGAAFKYVRDDGQFDAGGHFNTDSYGPLIHVNFVPVPKFFVDTAFDYTRKNYFISRVVSLNAVRGALAGDPDGNEYKVGVNSGYDFNFQNITIGPRVGLNYRRTEIDGYRERTRNSALSGIELLYNSQHENSLTSPLGLYGSIAISTGFGILVPQTTLEYVHEFLDPQRRIKFRLAQAPNATGSPFSFQNDPPDRNYFNLGAGIVAVLPHGVLPFLNYRALVGYKNQSSHIATVGLRMEF
jgi:outer membrane autotransporter protein